MTLLYTLLSFALRAHQALAIPEPPIKPPKTIGVGSPIGVACLGLKWLFTAAILFSIILALVAAFDYMRGGGSPDKIKAATNRLVFVAIGVAVAILARTMPVLIGTLIGAPGGTGNTSSICP